MQWAGITELSPSPGATQPGLGDEEPEAGPLPAAQAARLVAVLARFTGAHECFYAVRDGIGALLDCVGALRHEAGLEAWPVGDGHDCSDDSETINPMPPYGRGPPMR